MRTKHSQSRSVLLGAAAGFALGAAGVLAAHWRPRRVMPTDRIVACAGLPVLAEAPVSQNGLPPSPLGEPFLEGARFLRAAIQSLHWQRPMRAVLVMPVGRVPAADIVTYCLARSFAEAAKRVALIDVGGETGADVGYIDHLFGDSLRMDDAVRLPASRGGAEATPGSPQRERFSMARASDLLTQAAGGDAAQHVVISGAQLANPERHSRMMALRLMTAVDGVVILIDASEITETALKSEVDAVRSAGAHVVGVAVCRRERRRGILNLRAG
ncbi:MAG: hypothetical protein WD208_02485 [Dehalococcoidia bacterium]